MAYGDIRNGWHPAVLAAIVAAHGALLAVAASALHAHAAHRGRAPEVLVALFDEPASEAASGAVEPPPETRANAAPSVNAREASARSDPGKAKPIVLEIAPLNPVPAMHLQVAPAASEANPVPPDPPPTEPLVETESDALARYAGVLRSAIMAWAPRNIHKDGQALVAFRLDRSGKVLDAEIMRSSGDIQLDRLALRMVRKAAPFPPPDAAIPDERLDFTIPIRFH